MVGKISTGEDYCANCGQCCIAFLPPTLEIVKKGGDERNIRWMTEDIRLITPEDVIASGVLPADVVARAAGHRDYHTCNLFDRETFRCTDHENKPSICRSFPTGKKEQEPYTQECKLNTFLYTQMTKTIKEKVNGAEDQ